MSEEGAANGERGQGPGVPKVEARPRNWLEPVILVALREWNSYGYELLERLTEFGFEATNPGTLYRTLRRMESNGLCKSRWETSGQGPARRRYSVTAAGEAYLSLWIEALEQYQRSMDAFFRAYTGGWPRTNEKANE